MTVLRFPRRPSMSTSSMSTSSSVHPSVQPSVQPPSQPVQPPGQKPVSTPGLRHVSPNHPSLGMIWADNSLAGRSQSLGSAGIGSIIDLFPIDPPSGVHTQRISCGDCTMANSATCADCVVSLLADGPTETRSVSIDAEEAQTIELFNRAGLVPRVRHSCERAPGRAANW